MYQAKKSFGKNSSNNNQTAMRKIITSTILTALASSSLFSQNVGIGTATPSSSAKLEISSTNSGLLIPRVALAATNAAGPITAPATSLLVYNTATSGVSPNNVTPGYYFWTGSAWSRLLNTASSDWTLTGNAGTVAGTNFIGTTDAVDFVTRTNNAERIRVTSAGNVGIGTPTPGYRLDLANGTFAFGSSNVRTETRDNAGLQGNAGAQSGFFETASPVNYPSGASSWWHLIDARHSNNGNNYALQIAGSFFDQELWFRKTNGSATQAWTRLLTSTNGWGTTGNSGTVATTNFIGTIDAIDFVTRTGNTERMRVTSAGNVGVGINAPSAKLEVSLAGATAASEPNIRLQNTTNATGAIAGVRFRTGSGWDVKLQTSQNTDWFQFTDGTGVVQHAFQGNRFYPGSTSNNGANTGYITGNGTVLAIGIPVNTNNKLTADYSGNAGTTYGTNVRSSLFGFGGSAAYNFGVAAYEWGSTARSGAVIGSYSSGTWGTLGYTNSGGTSFGAYFTAAAGIGAGYNEMGNVRTGVGLGSFGGVMGGWIRGEVTGLTTSGELYASYNIGNEYTSGHQADVVSTENGRVAAYSNTSVKLKVYADGYSNIVNGEAFVQFDEEFIALMENNAKPVVTVNAVGFPVALYLKSVSREGFTVATVDGSSVNVELSWTAVATRCDNANTELPKELLNPKFDKNMKAIMHNDSNTERNALPIWWDGKTLRYDQAPIDPIKVKEIEQQEFDKKIKR
ncbi:MAG: hypothetical protein RLZ33_1783 [Bacteroidota bacterium]